MKLVFWETMGDCFSIAKKFLEALDKGIQPEVALANILELSMEEVKDVFVNKTVSSLGDEYRCFRGKGLITFFVDLALNVYPLSPRTFSGVLWEILRLIEKFEFIQEKIISVARKYLFRIRALSAISGLVIGLMPTIFWYIYSALAYGLNLADLAFLFMLFSISEFFAFLKLDLIARNYFGFGALKSIRQKVLPIYLFSALAGLTISFAIFFV